MRFSHWIATSLFHAVSTAVNIYSPNRNEYQKSSFGGGIAHPAHEADNFTAICELIA
jgi:hypothetical protein